MVQVAASILAGDFTALGSELERVDSADSLHLDVMDGQFVPNISFGPPVVDSIREGTTLPLDIHLMVAQPDDFVQRFAEVGARTITIHAEACPHLHRVVNEIHLSGAKAGVAINPGTGVHAVDAVLDTVDRVLVMSVDPGFSGQSFLPTTLEKVQQLEGRTDVEIAVDGGIGPSNSRDCLEAGADMLVSGSAIFQSEQPAETIQELKQWDKVTKP